MLTVFSFSHWADFYFFLPPLRLNFLEGTCCSGLETVLKTDAQCLCETFRNSAQLGITLNMTKALALPAACHVSAPAATNCAVSTGIGAAPALSPLVVSPSSVAGAPTAVGVGSNVGAPPPTPGSSGSSALVVSIELLVLTSVAVVAAYALF
ncbi:non-specific lipid-transfer protein-like protein at5g64080 [Phtheirospermum japonicum]|uniref:Non-specific lipid-transfer protein-like protein at5g64080 n=1 Tax=Phtheirospermum japonicum TaxID=374723 RepID=A0A830CMT3_9LAMI|nr:non-specific lipid-transfer protein-like protein at5g64080 [Phtheirospermum japonicum]